MAENAPVLVDTTLKGLVNMLSLSNLIVMVLLAPKLEPDTVTVVPIAPLVGVRLIIVCEVTVNVASTELTPSLAVILWLPPFAVVGIVIDLVNAPELFVVVSSTNAKSKRMDVTVFFAKPEPVTVTVEPGAPVVRDNVMLAAALACSM
ncbi:MAG: hypothetical protein HMLIMOIP_002188 [Candidatus Nitrosomirales archaeon]